MLGFESVIEGTTSLDDWLVDLAPVAEEMHSRLVVVMWPVGSSTGNFPEQAFPKLDGWFVDLDICYDEAPFNVSARRQPSAPSWVFEAANLF